KSQELFEAIKGASFENLILPPGFAIEIRKDISRFFKSREAYDRYQIPWKRGVLFIGPPGNGKTHAVKALINESNQPCLYVKSFKGWCGTDHDRIRTLFKQARKTTPCIVVLEDLDSLIDNRNRSFFLNELDGFAENTGVVVLATTNHPDQLDPAILDRPSRFDRKYYFELPAAAERRAYFAQWSESIATELRLSDEGLRKVVEKPEGFSFAYLKELCVSSMMEWINDGESSRMDKLIARRAKLLRAQMTDKDRKMGKAHRAGK